jgi:cobalt/nickel transport system permease protein
MELFSDIFKRDNILASFDARIKLVIAAVLLALVLSYSGWAFPLFMALLGLVVCKKMKIPMRTFVLRFSEPFFIALVLVTIKFLFSGKDIMFSLNILGLNIVGHKDGLFEGLTIASRMAGAVCIVAVLGFSTPFSEIMAGLSWLKIPRSFVEILLLAYRYIFVLLEEALVIYHAQRNRLGYSSLRRGLSSFGILTGSLTIRAFDHSQNVSTSMIQRGYDGTMPESVHKPFKLREVAGSCLFLAVMGLIWKM